MTAKPSKSDIESALAGRTKSSVRRPRPAAHSTQENSGLGETSTNPRRQNVLGGDLAGISKRPPRNRSLTRLGEISYANWIAGVVVLLILAVFLWPETHNPTTREIARQAATVDSAPFYSESRVDEQVEPAGDQSFTRDNDINRATEFRANETLEKQIRSLLDQAEKQLAERHYSTPSNANATLTYRQILVLQPGNAKARQGLQSLLDRFSDRGHNALQSDDQAMATRSLATLRRINNKSSEYQELSVALATWKENKKIAGILASASKSLQNEQLILPARDNALFYYQQVLEIDPNSSAALEGINSIANIYTEKANDAILKGQYEAATGYLATVSVIDPKHSSIPIIEKLITTAEPLAAQRESIQAEPVSAKRPRSSRDRPPSKADSTPTSSTTNTTAVSANRTPSQEAREQEAFDQQYLQRGLEAYYQGDYDAAVALLKPLADKGVSRAQVRIGYMYYLEKGFTRDRTEADRIIRAALPAIQKFADEGRAWAQSDIGSLYEDGLVLPKDLGEAIYWYRSAAEQGYPGAQTNLGRMYAEGNGVTSSRRTAIEWFQRAAKQGDIAAKRNLEAMGIEP